jgi:hypothetical protein
LASAHYDVLFAGLMFRKNDAAESRGQRGYRAHGNPPKKGSTVHADAVAD